MLPLPQISLVNCFSNVRFIATDMDGTLTTNGKFTPALLQALTNLALANFKVIIVTGRSSGWVSGLVSYLPIAGAVAENGGLFYQSGEEVPVTLTQIPDLFSHRQKLATAFQELHTLFPHIQESADNRFRITDWTFDVQGLSTNELKILADLCLQMNLGFTYSNVQCHIKPLEQDKAVGLLQVLRQNFPEYTLGQVLTVGDSPNDESLFDERYFPLSVGVANVREYVNQLKYQPAFITLAKEGQGFCELSDYILNAVETQNFY